LHVHLQDLLLKLQPLVTLCLGISAIRALKVSRHVVRHQRAGQPPLDGKLSANATTSQRQERQRRKENNKRRRLKVESVCWFRRAAEQLTQNRHAQEEQNKHKIGARTRIIVGRLATK
jgi:hypothetical protein